MKTCAMCKIKKEKSEFRLVKKSKHNDNFVPYSYCNTCERIRERNRYDKDKRGYETVRGRALNLLSSARRRSKKWPDFDLDLEFIISKLENGVCEITGIPFDYSCIGRSKKNPFAPSIDRINNGIGYTKNNTRLTLWAVNLMHGEMTDDQLVVMCKAVIEGLKK